MKKKPYNFFNTIVEKTNFREKYMDTYIKIQVEYYNILFQNLRIISDPQYDLMFERAELEK